MYALKIKGKMTLSHISVTEEELNEKVNKSFWLWRGMQEKGSDKKIDDFMERYDRVQVTIDKLV